MIVTRGEDDHKSRNSSKRGGKKIEAPWEGKLWGRGRHKGIDSTSNYSPERGEGKVTEKRRPTLRTIESKVLKNRFCCIAQFCASRIA